MALLSISLPSSNNTREMIAMLEVIQRELLRAPEDACLVTRDAHGEVRLRQSVRVTPGDAGGTFWLSLVQRLLILRDRHASSSRSDALVRLLRPDAATLFVITRDQSTFDRVIALAEAVGGQVTNMRLSRQSEFALSLSGVMPSAAHDAA